MLLTDLLESNGGDWAAAVAAYESLRKPEADAIAELALEHFQLLDRDAASAEFVFHERAARAIQRVRPELSSVYHNVSFTCLPYSRCLEIGQRQERVIEELRQALAIDGPEHPTDDEIEARAIELLAADQRFMSSSGARETTTPDRAPTHSMKPLGSHNERAASERSSVQ